MTLSPDNSDLIVQCRHCGRTSYIYDTEMHDGPDRCPECGEEIKEEAEQ